MQDREQQSPSEPTGPETVVGEDSAVGGTPTSGAQGDQGADPAGGPGVGADVPVADTDVPDAAHAQGADTGVGLGGGDAGDVAAGVVDPELERVRGELSERTADLQRLSAEYANYRRRVDRDRESTVTGAKAQVASELLTVLDDVERARAHGDLTGPFKTVGDRLVEALERTGLVAFGDEGDAFDPSLHEAVAHETSAEVTGPTVTTVMRRGYRFGERVLRPAMVAVTDLDPDAPAATGGADQEEARATASPGATNPDAV